MRVLVAYATKHGATKGIAERISVGLTDAGHDAVVLPADRVDAAAGFDAFVIGSATYIAHWRKEATELVHRLQPVVGQRPVWLFSSGPLGDSPTDDKGQDLKETAEPKELPELAAALHPREHRVFFGALDPSGLTLPEKAMRTLPAGRALLPEGDFRDWDEIDQWAAGIAEALTGT